MSTIVNHSIDIQKPKKWNRFFHDHLELIMAITSGLIILTAWLLGNYIPQSMEIILFYQHLSLAATIKEWKE